MSSQLERWQGEWGDDYTDRNTVDPKTRVEGFQRMLGGILPQSILEVGCNRGHNLTVLKRLCPGALVHGIEPNPHARHLARVADHIIFAGDIYGTIPWPYDLVFTCGVLEHVPPERLDEALTFLHDSTELWMLAIEYANVTDIEILYREQRQMLWKRDYGQHVKRLFPELTLVATGDLDGNFDHATYWLWEKP